MALYLDRRHRGGWAPNLESLSPSAMIRKIPVDPATGRPFTYRLGDGTAVLESAASYPDWEGRPWRKISLTLSDGC